MIKFLSKKILNFIKNKQAISAVAFAITTMAMVTVTMTAGDVARYGQLQSALQTLADQAVTSGLALSKAEGRAAKCAEIWRNGIANNSALKNYTTVKSMNCKDAVVGGNNTVELNASVKVKTYFSSSVGLGEFDVTVKSVAIQQYKPIEMAIALSMQGTMCSTVNTIHGETGGYIKVAADPNCIKINAVYDSVAYFLNKTIVDIPDSNMKIGVIPYNYKIKFPDQTKIPTSITALETQDNNFFKDFTKEEPLLAVAPLQNRSALITGNYNSTGKSYLDNYKELGLKTGSSAAWGRADIAMHAAALMLEPTQKALFKNHPVKAWAGTGSAKKYVILLSDGANLGCCYTNNPSGNFSNQYLYHYKPYTDHMLNVCKALKDKGTKVYVILVNVDIAQPGGKEIQAAMAKCASGDYAEMSGDETECRKKADCYNVKDANGIKAAFREIGQKLIRPRIQQ